MNTKKRKEAAKIIAAAAVAFNATNEEKLKGFDKCNKEAYESLRHFIKWYAYARQGAPPKYIKLAQESIKLVFDRNLAKVNKDDAKKVWNAFEKKAKQDYPSLKLNEKVNPLSQFKGKNKKNLITRIYEKQEVNITKYISKLIKIRKITEAYNFLVSIRGIGDKIATLYLMDVFLWPCNRKNRKEKCLCRGKHDGLEGETKAHLQPIDVWVRAAYDAITKTPAKSDEDVKNWIFDLCGEAEVCPFEFNRGAWFIGNQFAEDSDSFKKILSEPEAFKNALKKKIDVKTKDLLALEKFYTDVGRIARL